MSEASLHNTALPVTQTPLNIDAKGVRKLKLFSWDDITSWNSDSCSNLPSELMTLFKACSDKRSMASAPSPPPSCLCPLSFGLEWNEDISCFLCTQHSRLIPGDYIWQHLSKAHKQKYVGITRATVFKAALSHIMGCYPLIKNQSTTHVKGGLPAQLATPLPLPACELTMRYKCPVMSCPKWIHKNKGRGSPEAEYNRHMTCHTAAKENTSCHLAIAQWTQLVDIGAGRSKLNKLSGDTHCFTFPSISQTLPVSTSLFATVDHTAPSTQSWAVSLGWEEYVKSLALQLGSRQKAVTKLQDLVALPSKKRILKITNSTMMALEEGLLLSNKLNQTYMKAGVKWVNDNHRLVSAQFSYSM